MVSEYIVYIIFVGIVITLIVKTQMDIYRKHKAASNGVVNYDPTMHTFYYKVKKSKQEIADTLMVHSIYDEMEYSFDADSQIIIFSSAEHGAGQAQYQLTVTECDGFSILKVLQIKLLVGGIFSYLQNPFWTKKIQAEPIDYNLYS